jgi:hypothetical protein
LQVEGEELALLRWQQTLLVAFMSTIARDCVGMAGAVFDASDILGLDLTVSSLGLDGPSKRTRFSPLVNARRVDLGLGGFVEAVFECCEATKLSTGFFDPLSTLDEFMLVVVD